MAILGVTGFECGLASLNGTGLFETVLANASVGTTRVRNGVYALRVNPTAAVGNAGLPGIGAPAIITLRVALYLETLPAAATRLLQFFASTAADKYLAYDSADSKWKILDNGGAVIATGPVAVVDTWTLFDIRADLSANPHVVTWKVDGVSQPSSSEALAVSTLIDLYLGADTAAQTFDCWYDDAIWSDSAADYPFGNGKVIKLLPNADGTHSFTDLDFAIGDAGTGEVVGTTTLWTLVDDAPPWTTTRSTTDNISQRVIRTSGYVEIQVADTPETGTANAVRALLEYSGANTLANTGACIVRSSAGFAGVLLGDLPVAQGGNGGALADYSDSSNFFKGVVVTKPAAGWTPTEVNAIRYRLGGSGDITPRPTWQALMLEVDYPVSAAPFVRPKVVVGREAHRRSTRW